LKGFRYLDHVTDVIVESWGTSLEEAFEYAALALVNTMFDINHVSLSQQIQIEVEGHDLESLLYNWLEKVLIIISVDNIIMSFFKVIISKGQNTYYLTAIGKGEHLSLEKHHYKVEIKGVTYHEMKIEETNNKFTAKFLLDL
jgi:SHS2 domain-containing protein